MTGYEHCLKFRSYYSDVLESMYDHDLLKANIFNSECSLPMRKKQALYCAALKRSKVIKKGEGDNYSLHDSRETGYGLADLKLTSRKTKVDDPSELNFNTNPSVISVDHLTLTGHDYPHEDQDRIFIELNDTTLLGIPVVNPSAEMIYRYYKVTEENEEVSEDAVHGRVYDKVELMNEKYPAYVRSIFPKITSADSKGEFLRLDQQFLGVSTTPSPSFTQEVITYHVPLELDPLQHIRCTENLFLFVGRDQAGNGSCLFLLNTSNALSQTEIVWPAPWTKVMIGDSSTHVVLKDQKTFDTFEWTGESYTFSHRNTFDVTSGSEVGPISSNYRNFDIELSRLIENINTVVKEIAAEDDSADE